MLRIGLIYLLSISFLLQPLLQFCYAITYPDFLSPITDGSSFEDGRSDQLRLEASTRLAQLLKPRDPFLAGIALRHVEATARAIIEHAGNPGLIQQAQETLGYLPATDETFGTGWEVAAFRGDGIVTRSDPVNGISLFDLETGLLIGAPHKKPFKRTYPEDIEVLHTRVVTRSRAPHTVFSVSGLRNGIWSADEDESMPGMDWEGTDETITDAAAVMTASIVDQLVDFLKTDPAGFYKIKERERRANGRAAVVIDTRHTGPAIADIIVRTLLAKGVETESAFISSVTEASAYALTQDLDFVIVVTASHNPRGHNGFKILLNNGRVMPQDLAEQLFIPILRTDRDVRKDRGVLKDLENTKHIVQLVNGADGAAVEQVFRNIPRVRGLVRQNYRDVADILIADVPVDLADPGSFQAAVQQARRIKEETAAAIRPMQLVIGLDPNGGTAGFLAEIFDSWGFRVDTISTRPREDMVHILTPNLEATELARERAADLLNSGQRVIAYWSTDTDGDRRAVSVPHLQGVRNYGVQKIFVLDAVATALNYRGHKEPVIVVNGPTEAVMEALGAIFNFKVRRSETGEANVIDAAAAAEEENLYVALAGEGSNGNGIRTLPVRDPIHTLRTIINFILNRNDITKRYLETLGVPFENDLLKAERLPRLLSTLIEALPFARTTDFFEVEGFRQGIPVPAPLQKDLFDPWFESEKEHILTGIAARFGVPSSDIHHEYVAHEGRYELHGMGNRRTGLGGYKIQFYADVEGHKRMPIGYIWFRRSLTEGDKTRKGASVSNWKAGTENLERFNSLFEYLGQVVDEGLERVERTAVEEILTTYSPESPEYRDIIEDLARKPQGEVGSLIGAIEGRYQNSGEEIRKAIELVRASRAGASGQGAARDATVEKMRDYLLALKPDQAVSTNEMSMRFDIPEGEAHQIINAQKVGSQYVMRFWRHQRPEEAGYDTFSKPLLRTFIYKRNALAGDGVDAQPSPAVHTDSEQIIGGIQKELTGRPVLEKEASDLAAYLRTAVVWDPGVLGESLVDVASQANVPVHLFMTRQTADEARETVNRLTQLEYITVHEITSADEMRFSIRNFIGEHGSLDAVLVSSLKSAQEAARIFGTLIPTELIETGIALTHIVPYQSNVIKLTRALGIHA